MKREIFNKYIYPIIIIGGVFIYIGFVFDQLPNQVSSMSDIEVLTYKNFYAYVFPVTMIIIVLGTLISNQIGYRYLDIERMESGIWTIRNIILTLLAFVQYELFEHLIHSDYRINFIKIIGIALAVYMIMWGNLLPRIQKATVDGESNREIAKNWLILQLCGFNLLSQMYILGQLNKSDSPAMKQRHIQFVSRLMVFGGLALLCISFLPPFFAGAGIVLLIFIIVILLRVKKLSVME